MTIEKVTHAVQHTPTTVKVSADIGAIGAVGVSWLSIVNNLNVVLALVASLLSISWLTLQIYSWVEKRREMRRDKR